MSDDDNVRDEDELGENTFGSLDFESDIEDDVEGSADALDADIEDPLLADPLEDEGLADEEDEDEDDIDDGFSEFNDYEE